MRPVRGAEMIDKIGRLKKILLCQTKQICCEYYENNYVRLHL